MKKYFFPTAANISLKNELMKAIILAALFTGGIAFGTSQINIDREGHQDTTASAAKAMEESKPVNSPSIRTHRAQAEKVCGGAVVTPHKGILAPDVVVIKMNGKAVLMTLDEAFKRIRSKKHADNIWVIGACKSHVVKK